MKAGEIGMVEQTRIATYLNRQQVRPVLVKIVDDDKRILQNVVPSDTFLYDPDRPLTCSLPANGYQFPVVAILGIMDTQKETFLDLNSDMATRVK
jgi:hypothetical protein